ncbi:MAG: type II CAAX endopeptidase family protein [Candidatus Pelethousia sp.]|nr:type II CAAX endopeptidase family protein [Candidatus Pelethousia sp.]
MLEKKRIWIFVALSYGLAWIPGLILYLTGMRYGDALSGIWISSCMLMPAIASILTRAFTKEGFRKMGWRPGFGNGGWKWYLAAFFAPALLMLLGAAAYFLVFPGRFDPSGGRMAQVLMQAGLPQAQIPLVVTIQLVQGFLLGPIINVPFTLGEELGWRVYLLPKAASLYGRRKAILLSGLVWGVWHAPMIAMGHNYGTGYWGWPVLGILAMVVFCLAIGSFEALLTFRTQSVWPAAIAHSGLNAIAALPIYFAFGENSPFVGPMLTGILGGWAMLVLGVVCYLRCGKECGADVPQGDV